MPDHGDDKNKGVTSRRAFLTRGVVTAGVASAAASLPSVGAAAAPRRWDGEADVLVVGSGAAAMSAAAAVARAGGSVIVIEKAPIAGGTSAKSAGAYWIPNNHLMRAKGIDDPKADVVRYMVRDAYPARYREDLPQLGVSENEYALIETYYDQSAPIIEELETTGAIKSMIADVYDYVDHTPLNKAPRGRALVPQKPDGQIGRGLELVRQLKTWLTAKKVSILFNHAVTGVERNGKGEVIGLAVTTPDGPASFRARKAVVFGTGGYSQNQELLRAFQPGPIYGACSVPTAQGDFIKIGIQTGAMLGNMASAWRSQVVLEQALQVPSVSVTLEFPPGDSMLMVNKYGRRVVDEKRNYNVRARVHFNFDEIENEYPNDLLFMVFDQRSRELFAGQMHMPPLGATEDYVIQAATLPALATAIQGRLDALADKIGPRPLAADFLKGLQAQVAQFNADAKAGVDSQFHRGLYPYDVDWHRHIDSVERTDTKWPPNPGPNYTIYPLSETGPYFAIIVAGGMLDTNGGPSINAKAQVLDTLGRPIPGLYGAGNCVAAPGGQGYWGAGATLGPALTFGTIAGRHAHAEPVKEV
jgi:succinate dehydrogenase/fumarate reductase flavoprotein subunit